MADVNRVVLSGRLTRDPALRHTRQDRPVCHFGLACGRSYTDRSGSVQEDTTFVDVEAWSRLGESIAEHLGKGEPALVEGRLRLDRWEDAEGRNRSRLCVVAENVEFLGRAGAASQKPPEPASRDERSADEARASRTRRESDPARGSARGRDGASRRARGSG